MKSWAESSRAFLALSMAWLALPGASAGQSSERVNVLLVTIDTLRADRVGAYGSGIGETPHLDDLARRGVLFEQAFTHSPVTLSAHATLLTGRLPQKHGVRSNSFYRLPDEEVTIAEVLRNAGYRTAAFVSASALDRRFGLTPGFEVYDDDVGSSQGEVLMAERNAASVVQKARAWLQRQGAGAPFFLWVHFFDPHYPYAPPEPFASRFATSPYDGEVAFVDRELGTLLGELARKGLDAKTLVVVTADHGEGLGEHGEETHGIFLYDSTLRVPLLMAGPGIPRGRRETKGPVGLVDVFPTLLARLGVEGPEGLEGEDLLEPDQRPLLLYAETFLTRDFYNWSPLRAVRSATLKLIEAPEAELYDLGADPGEERNILAQQPGIARQLRARLEAMAREGERESAFQPSTDLLSRMQSLGYLGIGPPPTSSATPAATRPDPKRMIGIVRALDEVIGLLGSRRFSEAEKKLEDILALDPENFLAIHYRAEALFELSRDGEALDTYRTLIAQGRDTAYYRFRGAVLLERLGRFKEAAQEFGLTVDRDPRAATEVFARARRLLDEGKTDPALTYFEVLSRRGSGGPALYLAWAEARAHRGDPAAALEILEQGLEESPSSPELLVAKAGLLQDRGRDAEAVAPLERALGILDAPEKRVPVLRALGTLRGERGEFDQAVRCFQEAVTLAPEDFESWANLALTLIRAGRDEDALLPLTRAIELGPREVRLLNLKAEIHFRRGELEESRGLLQRSLGVEPNQPRIRKALADVEARLSGSPKP